MLIDVHAHYVPPVCFTDPRFGFSVATLGDFGPRLMRGGVPLGPHPETQQQLSDIDVRLAEMDAGSVNMQALSVDPGLFFYDLDPVESAARATLLNDELAAVVEKHPDRFVALGTVSLQDVPLAIEQLEQCMGERQMRGVEICTNVSGKNIGEPEFAPFWAAAEALDATVLLHPYNIAGGDRAKSYAMRVVIGNPYESTIALYSLIYSGVLERHPQLRTIFVHGGGAFPYLLGRIRRGADIRTEMQNLLPQPLDTYLRRVFVNTVVHDPIALRYLIDVWGVNLIVPGTDYPYDMGDFRPRDSVAAVAGLSADDAHQILETNAARALGMKPADSVGR